MAEEDYKMATMLTQPVISVVAEQFLVGELERGTKFWARIDFECPRCHREHVERVDGIGPTPLKVICHCVATGEEIEVRPWTEH